MKHVLYLVMLALISSGTFFVHLEKVNPGLMEARNFVTAREMVQNGNWLIPSMDGNIRVAKPPLPTWLTAFSRMIGGDSDGLFAMRAPAALSATLMVFFFFGLCLQLNGRNHEFAFLASAVLATNVLVIQMARTNSWDIFSQSFMVAALWFLVQGLTRERNTGLHFLGVGIAMGLSFLSKGPAAFFAPLFPFGVAYIWTYGFRQVWRRRIFIIGAVIVSGMIGLLWPLPVYLKYPEVARSVFEVEARARMSLHGNPWYYYLDFPYMAGLWVILFITAFAVPYVRRRSKDFSVHRLGLVWLVLTVLLLSVLPEKKERYLLPVSLPMSLLIGQVAVGLTYRFRQGPGIRADRIILLLHALGAGFLTLALPLFLGYLRYGGKGAVSSLELVFVSVSSVIFMSALILLYRRHHAYGIFLTSILLVTATCLFALPYSPLLLYTNPDYRTLKKELDLSQVKNLKLYRTDDIGMEVVWDIGRSPGRFSESKDMLMSEGKVFALFSQGHPLELFSEDERKRVNLEVLEVFDYGEKRSKAKIYLSLVIPIPVTQ